MRLAGQFEWRSGNKSQWNREEERKRENEFR